MSRMSSIVPNLARRLGARARSGVRIVRGRSAWSAVPARIERLILVPVDLETPDRGFVDEIAAGQLALGGLVVDIGRMSPFAIEAAPERWAAALNGFRWLAHLRNGEPRDVALSRRLVGEWLVRNRRPAATIAWRADVMASRISAWLASAHLVLDGADPAFYRDVLASLGAQARHLDSQRPKLPQGRLRVDALVAVLLTGLAAGGSERHLTRLERELERELEAQVLADGCHRDRNPGTVLELLLRLLPLRECIVASGREVPAQLGDTIRRMTQFLARMELGDGTLMRVNGMGRTPRDLLSAVLSSAMPMSGGDLRGKPEEADRLPASGLVRIEAGQTVLLVDAGGVPPAPFAAAAHAGTLAFEMSVGSRSLLRNCGVAEHAGAAERTMARATACHNTLVLDARSSSRLAEPARAGVSASGALIGLGRVAATLAREAGADGEGVDGAMGGGTVLTASHEGYLASHGLVHTRRLRLSDDGRRLDGTDALAPARGVLRLAWDVPFAIFFHVAAGVDVATRGDGCSADLVLDDGERWRLEVEGARLSVEASVDFTAVAGPLATRQLVLRGACPGETRIEWRLERVE